MTHGRPPVLTSLRSSTLSASAGAIAVMYRGAMLQLNGAADSAIQALLRWKTPESLKLYALLNDCSYADWQCSSSDDSGDDRNCREPEGGNNNGGDH